jgi:hypothetical protein
MWPYVALHLHGPIWPYPAVTCRSIASNSSSEPTPAAGAPCAYGSVAFAVQT